MVIAGIFAVAAFGKPRRASGSLRGVLAGFGLLGAGRCGRWPTA